LNSVDKSSELFAQLGACTVTASEESQSEQLAPQLALDQAGWSNLQHEFGDHAHQLFRHDWFREGRCGTMLERPRQYGFLGVSGEHQDRYVPREGVFVKLVNQLEPALARQGQFRGDEVG